MKPKASKPPSYGTLADVKAEVVEWAWGPYIPYRMLTILEGDPDLGKTFLTLWLAALISIGGKLPDGQRVDKGNVLIINGEDDPAFTIRPRIDALGGDPGRIRYMANYSPLDDAGLDELQAEIRAHRPRLIIIDPVLSYVPASANLFQANHIRPFLTKLTELAREADAALVVLRHLRKAGGDKQLYTGTGSIDVIAVARSAIRVFQHPDDEDLKVFSHLKHNLSEEGQSLLYRIASEDGSKMPKVIWEGPCDLRAADAGGEETKKPPTKVEQAKEFLRKELSKHRRPATATLEKAIHYGHAKRTMDRAQKELGIVTTKKGASWFWSLPDA